MLDQRRMERYAAKPPKSESEEAKPFDLFDRFFAEVAGPRREAWSAAYPGYRRILTE